MSIQQIPNCVLCESANVQPIAGVNGYFLCAECDAHFLHPQLRLDPAEEKARYDIHRNDVTDTRYLQFLNPLFAALDVRIARQSSGLDFGAGPAPALAQMFERAGHSMAIFDPFYWPAGEVLNHTYDFISCSEAAEHFYRPRAEFERMFKMLKPGGWLGIMTQLVEAQTDFANWYYRRDPTHVVFYSLRTFQWLQENLGFTNMVDCGPRVVLLQRPQRL